MGEAFLVQKPEPYANPETTFAFLQAPSSYSSAYINVWSRTFSHGPAVSVNSTGITVAEAGYYYIEYAHRALNTSNGYVGIGLNGDRTALEGRSTGMWTHDHSAGVNKFSHSKYVGYLNAGEKITAGPPSSSVASSFGYSSDQKNAFLFLLRLDMSEGNFSETFGDYAWKDGTHSWISPYITRFTTYGENGSSLISSNSNTEISVLEDGWYWIEAGHRSNGSQAEIVIALSGNPGALQNKNDVMWAWDESDFSNTHAHAMCVAYLTAGDKITAGTTSSTGQVYSTSATGWSGFLRAIRIDNQGGNETSRNRIDVGWKEGPSSYVGDQLVNWGVSGQWGSAVSQNGRNLQINETGHYYFEYGHRVSGSTDGYGTLSSNGNRETYENNNNGMWTHDHSQRSANHVHSKWLGPVNSGSLVAAGPDSSDSSNFTYNTQGYTGVLFAMRLK